MTDQIEQTAPIADKTFAGLTRTRMAEYRSEFGEDRVKAATIPLGDGAPLQWVYRAPSRLEFDRHTETLMKIRDNKVAQALGASRTLVLACTLAPGTDALAAALDKYPALADKLSEPILKLAGAEIEVREETF